ncbi:hypothetical protein K501DRAFT_283889 [Backusella circina FSU 941]|nr:hypothetical protein K501DRAFT_283889 [Backusella circina FSU 941]
MWSLASKAHVIAVTGVYFSVLGGAFCSLGKANSRYALKASALAIQQIRLAQRLKDPILECKCWLYFAEDLIQLGNIRKANKVIKSQARFIESIQDPILTSMFVSVLGKRDTAANTITFRQ